MALVSTSWNSQVNGNPMYQLTTKLCILKAALCKFHHQHTKNIASRVATAQTAWQDAQLHMDSNPTSIEAKTIERSCATLYMQLCKDEESLLKQRSRINWLKLGDRNTKFFHNSLLQRQVRNQIHSLQNSTGSVITDQQEMGNLASTYYQQLLSEPQPPFPGSVQHLFPNLISETSSLSMNLPITDEDIKAVLFSIPDNKSLGPDGYNSYFFKHCWSIIGTNFVAADGGWNFPAIPALQQTWNTITFIPNIGREDQCIWRLNPLGTYTIKSAWDFLRGKKPLNNLCHILWFKGHIPRHSFIMWLASLGRLRTMDRLHGSVFNTTCILCGHHMETHEHLLFDCHYTNLVWKSICQKANIHWPRQPWMHLLRWTASSYKQRNDSEHLIARLLLSTTVYFLWFERNNRVFTNTSQTYQTTVEAIYQQVRTHIAHMDIACTFPARIRAIWNLQHD
uniref:Reverse transcriptase zinc-binding domain-containing protein n=1 Tax=Populus alba TaxID=43335 RepID=A0A4V6A7P4_POPAL|nr:hypothetical protein D5086_0000206760 [Populus alba]